MPFVPACVQTTHADLGVMLFGVLGSGVLPDESNYLLNNMIAKLSNDNRHTGRKRMLLGSWL